MRRGWRWGLGVMVVVILTAVTAGLFSALVANNRADDPRSPLPTGTAALAQLLTDEGVRITTTGDPAEAIRLATDTTTLVVANPGRLDEATARELATASYGRLILLRPTLGALRSFGVAATLTPAAEEVLAPGCDDRAAERAGPILLDDARALYRSGASALLSCYRARDGAAYLRVPGSGGPVDLVAGGVANAALGAEGNAAFGMNVFGSQPDLVWLMSEAADPAGGRGEQPTLLPAWWAMALVQLVVALVVLGVWQGRRLGPILTEALPVRVRSSETVVGHGRLYYRIGARDRAAEGFRAGARDRLGRRLGHRFDADALIAALADRTGRDRGEVRHLLYGPAPATDDDLLTLVHQLDSLDQETRP